MDRINNQLCDNKHSCLIIIDIQEKLSAAIPDKIINHLRQNITILLNAANTLAIPVIITAQYPKGLGQVESFITTAMTNTNKQFEKTCFSCLGADGLANYLKSLNKKQVILTGIEAHICVLQSALELNNPYDVFAVTDAIASRKSNNYRSALHRLDQNQIHLVTTESVLFEWLRDAAHPDFKALSKTIR